MLVRILLFFSIIARLGFVEADSCFKHEKCTECIRDSNSCVWCTSTELKYDKSPRCRNPTLKPFDPTWCIGSLATHEDTDISRTNDINFSSKTGGVIQIKPQTFKAKLRPGQPQDFNFSFQGAKNYPVDLYILMDASNTMADTLSELIDNSEKIYKTLQNLTKKVFMGFGTFIDKNIAPFTREVQTKSAYSFKHRLQLTSNYSLFKDAVQSTKFGTNVDQPEGGFDALAQLMACDVVGWRENSRRIIVLITDSPQHVVGDGRSAGIFKPFDGQCYLDAQGFYSKELEMDYPSLTKLSQLAIAKQFTIIFAPTDDKQSQFFKNLLDVIYGCKVAELTSGTLVAKLIETYKEISTKIKLIVDVKSENRNKFKIEFVPDCTRDVELAACKVETGEKLNFTGRITLTDYYEQDTETIEISIQGITEKLTLNVEVVKCTCDADEVKNSPHCYNQTLKCGSCDCDDNTYGYRCMCNKGVSTDTSKSSSLCVGPTKTQCSDNGVCVCGKCKCNQFRFGTFCQCDHRHCPGYNGSDISKCGGHGTCVCTGADSMREECLCSKGWSHKPGAKQLGCVCSTATDACINPVDGTSCSNRGSCVCNACECDPLAQWDKRSEQGPLCQVMPNPSRHSQQCNFIRPCVLCHMQSDDCHKECDGVVLKKKTDVLSDKDYDAEWRICDNQKVDLGCYTKFVYKYDDTDYKVLLLMQEKTNCTESFYMYGGILLASLLLVGIFTLVIWKVFTNIQDRREFEKFEAQNKDVLNKPSENPLYDGPTTTFRNPAFKKSFSK